MGIILMATLALIARRPARRRRFPRRHTATRWRSSAPAWSRSNPSATTRRRRRFRRPIRLEPNFEAAYYGLGQTYMRKHQYAEAVQAYSIPARRSGRTPREEAMGDVVADQRLRDQIQVLKDTERALQRTSQASTPQNVSSALDRIRSQITLLESRRERREHDAPPPVPAGLSMALGSAYFRLGRHEDAEREYKAAVAADAAIRRGAQQSGRALPGDRRYDLADAEVKAAEKAGFKVNPDLKADIKKKRGG